MSFNSKGKVAIEIECIQNDQFLSAVMGVRMTEWKGHKQATTAALLNLATTAFTGRTRFSQSERAFFTACEFWAACRNGSLADLLASDACSQLEAAEISFNAIGLTQTANALGRARAELTGSFATTDVVKTLEVNISQIAEPVDLVLARFASRGVVCREETWAGALGHADISASTDCHKVDGDR